MKDQDNKAIRVGTVLEGVVVSDKMNSTAVVAVTRLVKHAKYLKYIKIRKRYKAENPDNQYVLGDRVKMQSCRPLSKDKHFKIVEKVGHSNIVVPRGKATKVEAKNEEAEAETPEGVALEE